MKEKQQYEEYILKIIGLIKIEYQSVVEQLLRVTQERFKAENERIRNEGDLDKLEEELNSLIKGSTNDQDSKSYMLQNDEKKISRA